MSSQQILRFPRELWVLAAALMVAVAASSAVGFFTARINAAIEAQAGEAIGADLRLSDRAPISDDLSALAQQIGLQRANTVVFPSVVLAGEQSSLASLKAVDPEYPLRGTLRTAPQPFAPDARVAGGPPRGSAWIDARLAGALAVAVGDSLDVGATTLTVDAILTYEPDRGGGFTTLAPRLMFSSADLAATELLGLGSRARYSLLVAGERDQLETLRDQSKRLLKNGQEWASAESSQAQLGDALERARRFMRLAALAAVLLAAVAMGMTAAQYASDQQDAVALKKTMGATGGQILRAEVRRLAVLALGAGAAGALIGYGAQAGLVLALGEVVQLRLPAPPLFPAVPAILTGLVALLGFATPALARLRQVPPIRVFQRQVGAPPVSIWFALLCAGAAVVALLVWQTQDVKVAGVVLVGAVMGLAALAALGWLFTALLAPLRARIGGGWRYGLANLSRHRGRTVLQLVSIGLGLTVLLLLAVVRGDLLSAWKQSLPADAPNAFLINIQPDQVPAVEAFFAERGLGSPELYPMALGRLVEVNGEPVSADDYTDPDAQRLLEREFNLSWMEQLGPGNTMIEGQWWGEAGRGQPLASIEKVMQEWFGFELGDTLTFEIAGQRKTLTIDSFREVEWDTFAVNFFLVTPPGVFDDAPATWLTSLHVPPDDKPALIDLVRQYPNITVFDVDVLLAQVRRVIDRVSTAVEVVFLFTLAAGLLVLLAALQASRAQRLREAALMRTLGASRNRLRQGVLAEFGALGLLAGLLAATAAQGIASVLAATAFDMTYAPRASLWLTGAIAGVLIAAIAAWFGARSAINRPPLATLR